MKIRTQYIFNTFVFGMILLLASASAMLADQKAWETHTQEMLATQLEREAYELGYLTNDYLLYGESQQAGRWESKFASSSQDLSNVKADTLEKQALLDNIKTNQQRLKAVFADVKTTLERESPGQGAVMAPAFMQASWSQLEVQNQGIIFEASRLTRMLREQEDQLRRVTGLLNFVLIAAFGAFLLVNYGLTFRRVLKAIADLQAGTKTIGSGNLDFAIAVKHADEIGELSRAFNRMTSDLKDVTASKAELEREIAERQRVEAALQEAKEHLESRVKERTAELEQANRALQEEIAERKRAEGTVKAERQRLYNVLETLPAYAVLLSADYHVPFANRFFRERFGESHGQCCFEYLFGRSQPCEICESYTVMKTNAPHRWEWIGPDGRNYDIYDFPFTDADGSRLVMEMGLDITERKQAEAELLRYQGHLEELVKERTAELESQNVQLAARTAELSVANENLRAARLAALNVMEDALEARKKVEQVNQQLRLLSQALESAANGVAITDRQGHILWVNPAFTRLTGYSADEAVGQNTRVLKSGQHPTEFYHTLWETILRGEPWRGHMINRRKDGSLYHEEMTITPVRADGSEITHFVAIKQDVTQQLQAEQALRESEERYRSLFNSMTEGFALHEVICDEQGEPRDYRFLEINPAFERLTGLKREDVIGQTVRQAMPGIEPVWIQAYGRVALTGEPAHLEEHAGALDRHYEVFAYRPAPGQFAAIFVDVTERKQAEEALRRAKEELELRVQERTAELARANVYNRSLIEASLDPLVTIGPDGKITDVNAATELVTACSRQELIGTDFSDYFTKPERARAVYQRVFDEGSVRNFELELVHRDGHLTSVLYNASVYRDEAGQVVGVFAAARDITKRKLAEEQLRLQSAALEAAANGIIIADVQGNIQWANPAFAQMTGYARGEVIGQNPRFLKSGVLARQDYQQLWETILSGQVWRGQLVNRRQDGSLYTEEQTIAPVRNAEAEITHFVAIKQDITDRKRAEAQLERNNEELRALSQAERSQRLLAETLSAANLALTQTLDLTTVMETLLDYVGRLVPYDSANVMLLEAESRLSVRVTRGYERWVDAGQTHAISFDVQANPILKELFTTRKSILVPDTRTHPSWEIRPGAEHVQSWLGVPLMAGGNVIGVYSLDKMEPSFFTQEHVRRAEMLVGQAAVAIQNAWLFEQVRAGRERLQSLSRRLVEVQEAERHYVARELHDEVGQALTSLKFSLGQLGAETDPAQHAARIAELKHMTDEILESLHRLAMNLRPASLDHLGLVSALNQYVRAIGDRYGLIAQFKAVDMGERLPPAVETALYRIVQEALTNVVRHARATRADVLLERRGDQVIVVVEDDGLGFDAQAAHPAQGGHLGLVGMQERAEMLGGSLVIESTVGAGTTVAVEVPDVYSYPHRG